MKLKTKMPCMGDTTTFNEKDRVCSMCKIVNPGEYFICKRVAENSKYYNECSNSEKVTPELCKCKLTGDWCKPCLENCTTSFEKSILGVEEFTGE